MRSILIAAIMKGEATDREFWTNYSSEKPLLEGLRVHDPFMGGGATLIEASRLGAAVSGTDVDPTAEMIVSHSLQPAGDSEVGHVGDELMAFLREHFLILYPDDDGEAPALVLAGDSGMPSLPPFGPTLSFAYSRTRLWQARCGGSR